MSFANLRTYYKLGLKEVLNVLLYRIGIYLTIHPACNLKSESVEPPFISFEKNHIIKLPERNTLDNHILLFGHINNPINNDLPNWLKDPISNNLISNELLPWWKINEFDSVNIDIKCIWEQSRMDWLIPFSQRIRKGDESVVAKLNLWVSDWLKNNPPYFGPNWKCGQEASIRVINIACSHLILGNKYTNNNLVKLIEMHLKRISVTIKYAIAQNNNHGTSEAAALFIGGSWLELYGINRSQNWKRDGRKYLEERVEKLIENDGSFSQYSLNYHRMMLDTFSLVEIWRKKFGQEDFSENFYKKISKASDWLYEFICPHHGDGPNIGANDGSKLLNLTNSAYRDFRPSVHLAKSLFQNQIAYKNHKESSEHLLWLGVKEGSNKIPRNIKYDYDEGGYKILKNDQARLFFRFPNYKFRPSQCDALHIDLWLGESNILCDAGTYSYNAEESLLDYFSGSKGHNNVEFDNRNQMPKISRFLYGSWLKSIDVSKVLNNNGNLECKAGYIDCKNNKHLRKIEFSKDKLIVKDDLNGFKEKAVIRWRLNNDEWTMNDSESFINVTNGNISLIVTGNEKNIKGRLIKGWKSLYYLDKEEINVLEVEVHQSGEYQTTLTW